ncbi:acetyltransferase [Galliscardovia ingluviei]|uniref:Acetyltransferase n=1 Tax=Galliscardovia ingluviei TaxID=1769422 RepID=A0A8J3AG37_9BIFI|nr:GNAT family N-acetyltransferase [Galliscardovia ingluviei]GGI13678.1 acetyltransferase [Galliscardovia ingluviei]
MQHAPKLTTERLILRAWQDSDAEALYTAASNPEIGPLAGWMPHTSVAQSAQIIDTIFNEPTIFAITLKNDDTPIGCVGLKPCSPECKLPQESSNQHMELGYWLAQGYWGQGIIPEAAERVIQYGFEQLALQAIWGVHEVGNRRSRRVMEKLGMQRVAIAPHIKIDLLGDDVYWDEAINRITRQEWEAEPQLRDRLEAPSEGHVLAVPYVQPEGVVNFE